jgi:hypothetical protein
MRWQYNDPLLAWLLVAAYGAHILEEWFGGFPEWVASIAGAPLPRGAFLAINAVALFLVVVGTRVATRGETRGWIAIAVAAVLFVNALLHVLGSLLTATYSPGMFTGVILYLPLGGLALLRAWDQTPGRSFARGVLAGLVAHAAVFPGICAGEGLTRRE